MSRTFDGSNDEIQFSLGNADIDQQIITVAVIAKRSADGGWRYLYAPHDSVNAEVWSLRLNGSGTPQFPIGATTMTFTVADNWVLLVVTRPTGATVMSRFHKYVFSTRTWTHENASGNGGDGGTAGAGGTLRMGVGTFGNFAGDILAQGVWEFEMSDAEVERLSVGLQQWISGPANPKALWVLNQAAVGTTIVDLTGGGANESAITDTAVSTNSDPPWNLHGHVLLAQVAAAAAGGLSIPVAMHEYRQRHQSVV